MEMRDDFRLEFLQRTHFIFQRTIAHVLANRAAPEILLHPIENFRSVLILTHTEARTNFPTQPHPTSTRERNQKAPFTVDEAGKVRAESLVIHRELACDEGFCLDFLIEYLRLSHTGISRYGSPMYDRGCHGMTRVQYSPRLDDRAPPL